MTLVTIIDLFTDMYAFFRKVGTYNDTRELSADPQKFVEYYK